MSDTSRSEAIARRVKPLLEALRPVHGDGIRSVVAYGPAVAGDEPDGLLAVLVVLDEAGTARLRQTAPAVGQLRRDGIEPLFLCPGEIASGADVFPLEFLEMQAAYLVVAGEDPLAGMEIPRHGLRLQVEEDLRSALHWLRQETARLGHRELPMRTSLARSFTELGRVWRGLLVLSGEQPPSDATALLARAVELLELDRDLLFGLHDVATGAVSPGGPALDELIDRYDALLNLLVARVDAMEA